MIDIFILEINTRNVNLLKHNIKLLVKGETKKYIEC